MLMMITTGKNDHDHDEYDDDDGDNDDNNELLKNPKDNKIKKT